MPREGKPASAELFRFVLQSAGVFAANLGLLSAFREIAGLSQRFSFLLANLITFLVSFFLMRYFVFRAPGSPS